MPKGENKGKTIQIFLKKNIEKIFNAKIWDTYSNNYKIYQSYVFPPYINMHNNMFCLKQFNNFINKSNFEFGHCCICNENKFIH